MTEPAPPNRNRRIAAIDGLRGISILLVVTAHLTGIRYNVFPKVVADIAGVLGHWGVEIFFVISGFIITRLALEEHATKGRLYIASFYIRRFFRIVPPFYIYLGFIAVVAGWGLIPQNQSALLAGAAFTCNLPYNQCSWFDAHTWTLAFEEQFYLIFPLLFAACGRRFGVVIAAVLVALIALPFLAYAMHLGDDWRTASGFANSFSYICIGCVIAVNDDWIKHLATSQYAIYLTTIVMLMLIGFLVLGATFTFPLGSTAAHLQMAAGVIVLPVCFAWIVGSTAHQQNSVTRALSQPVLQFFGAISYSLYLWQQMFTADPNLYIKDSWLRVAPLMLIMAVMSYYLIERPSIRLGRRLLSWLSRRQEPTGATQPASHQ